MVNANDVLGLIPDIVGAGQFDFFEPRMSLDPFGSRRVLDPSDIHIPIVIICSHHSGNIIVGLTNEKQHGCVEPSVLADLHNYIKYFAFLLGADEVALLTII